MHEAGLAMTVAEALRDERRPGDRVRLLVTGGQARPEDFDASLRLHLSLADPALDQAELEIVHLPTERLCIGCGRDFQAAAADAPCPACGSIGLAVPSPERIDIQLVHPGAGGP